MIPQPLENPHATIGIICPHPFFYDAFFPVYKHLEGKAEFILDFTAVPIGGAYREEEKNRMRDFFREKSCNFRDIEKTQLTPGEFFSKYSLLVGGNHEGWMAHAVAAEKKKVRIFYGGAKDTWTFGIWNVFFDLILCFGTYHFERLQKYGVETIAIGNPKFDGRHFNKKEGPIRTVAYLPTWGALSSLPRMVSLLPRLNADFDLVIKPHHMTLAHDTKTVIALKDMGIRVIDDTASVVDVLDGADVVISDNSGVIFETLHAKRPIVLADISLPARHPNDQKLMLIDAPFYSINNEYAGGVPTSRDSIEQTVKRPGSLIGPVFIPPHPDEAEDTKFYADLIEKIGEANEERFDTERNRIIGYYYAHRDGMAGKRAADAILALLTNASPVQSPFRAALQEYTRRSKAERLALAKIDREHWRLDVERIRQLPFKEKVKELSRLFRES